MLPPPASPEPFPADRKAALAMAEKMESPAAALARRQRGEPPPPHYRYPWGDT
jgi:hypothetical protein